MITPGPWHVRTLDGSQWSIDDAGDNTLAQAMQVKPISSDYKQAERTANARLIASAPELLEALEQIVVRAAYADDEDVAPDVRSIALAAILKARGEA